MVYFFFAVLIGNLAAADSKTLRIEELGKLRRNFRYCRSLYFAREAVEKDKCDPAAFEPLQAAMTRRCNNFTTRELYLVVSTGGGSPLWQDMALKPIKES